MIGGHEGRGKDGPDGIVGHVGREPAADVLIGGLRRLEYRGYNSAGTTVADGRAPHLVKDTGKASRLEQRVYADWSESFRVRAIMGIAHTRWAPPAGGQGPYVSAADRQRSADPPDWGAVRCTRRGRRMGQRRFPRRWRLRCLPVMPGCPIDQPRNLAKSVTVE